jgi:HEAT repeat protein
MGLRLLRRSAPRNDIHRSGIVVLGLTLLAVFGCGQSRQSSTSPLTPAPSGGDPQAQAGQIILDGLADPDPQVRANAIEVVVTSRQVPFMSRVQRMLHDEAIPVRFLAILAVGDLSYSVARDEVAQQLADPNPNIRMAAAYSMMKLGETQYYKVFRDQVLSEDQTVRANAALLLGKSGQKDVLVFLYRILRLPDSSDKVVFQALESIAMQRDERIYRTLWSRLISKYADDRLLGIRAMGTLGTDQAKNAIITMLDDNVLEVRLAAAEQLGKLGEPIGEAKVAEVFTKNLLADMDIEGQQRVKVLSALAIGEIRSESLGKYLPQLLRDPSKPVRLAAAKAVMRRAAR